MQEILTCYFRFMLYHLFQTAISKDITLHVSANNNAMVKEFVYTEIIHIYTFFSSLDLISKVWL